MDKLVLEIIRDIAPEEIDRITTVVGFVVLIAKIIERTHKKKNLTYDDSKRLVELVLDILVKTLEDRSDVPPELKSTLDFVKNHRMVIIEMIDDVILVWDIVVPKICGCCWKKKKESRIAKSYIDAKKSDIHYVRVSVV